MDLITVKPTQAFKLLGTGIVLDPKRVYLAVNATNIPDWRATRSVFLLVNGDGSPASIQDAATSHSFLLSGVDYTSA